MQMFGCSTVATLIQTVQVTAAQRGCVGVEQSAGKMGPRFWVWDVRDSVREILN